MSNNPFRRVLSLVVALLFFLGSASTALASAVDVAVVDVTVPLDKVTLQAGASSSITINMSVTGNQVGTATFEVYRDWTLSGDTFTGSNPQEFTVAPRGASDPATTFSTSGTVTVSASQAAGPFNLTVGAFDITNSNSTGAKLGAGKSDIYSVTVVAGDTVKPVLNLPEDMTVEATSAAGAIVNYTATAEDSVDGPVTVISSPTSGSVFPIGTTTVSASATDKAGNKAEGTFKITVQDTTAPVIKVPTVDPVEAMGPDGAEVTFEATAYDLVDGDVEVIYSHEPGTTFPLGDTLVTVTAEDKTGNEATETFTVTVQDKKAPVIKVPTVEPAEATGPDGAEVMFEATAFDTVDGDVEVSYSHEPGSTFPLGDTEVIVTAEDKTGNKATKTFTVTVQDKTAPIIKIPDDFKGIEATGPQGAKVSFSASALDVVDGAIEITYSQAPDTFFKVGVTEVTVTARDEAGNSSTATFTVEVVDSTRPEFTFVPSDILKVEATGPAGALVTFDPATATDLVDQNVDIEYSKESGSSFELGVTTVTVTAIDNSGNFVEASFKVEVVDTTKPVITKVPADQTEEATGPEGAEVTLSGAEANDLVDTNVEITYSPSSKTIFGLGEHVVTVTATDDSGNTATETFKVIVQDTTDPVITAPVNITKEATGPNGREVTFAATAKDAVDKNVNLTYSPASGSVFPLGTTTVKVTAQDFSGNESEAEFTVTIQDTTAPGFTKAPEDIQVYATGAGGAVVNFETGAFDLVDGDIAVKAVPASGSRFPIGTTTVNLTATDSRGNVAEASFTVTVKYDFSGFFQPIDMDKTNKVKAGSAIPIKFSLKGDMGLDILADRYPSSVKISTPFVTTVDEIETVVTAANSGLTYDSAADQYIYVWKTDKAWAGTYRRLTVKLMDGTIKTVDFSFTK